jgi:glucose dehydrogenase
MAASFVCSDRRAAGGHGKLGTKLWDSLIAFALP